MYWFSAQHGVPVERSTLIKQEILFIKKAELSITSRAAVAKILLMTLGNY
jgi:hypothetical protein